MRRAACLLLIATASLFPSQVARAGTPLCHLHSSTGRLRIHLPAQTDYAPIVLARSGEVIVVDGVPCDGATVTTTDSIVVDGEPEPVGWSHRFEIDLAGGPFAAGRTDEGDGSSEIEMAVNVGSSGPDEITIRGGAGADVIATNGSDINLDAAPDAVPDVRLSGLHGEPPEGTDAWVDSVLLHGVGGEDMITATEPSVADPPKLSASGGEGVDRIESWFQLIRGGPGNDVLVSTGSRRIVVGGPGRDRLVAARTSESATLLGRSGRDILLGSPGTDTLIGEDGDDRLVGAGGNDILLGIDGDDRLDGGDGRDLLNGESGDDLLLGGRGVDFLLGGTGRDRCDDDPRDEDVISCHTHRISG